MQVSHIDNKLNFAGVIPVNVYLKSRDAQHLFDYHPVLVEDTVRKCCNQVVKVLAGPVRENPRYANIVKKISEADKGYSLDRAMTGYCLKGYDEAGNIIKETPSLYFKVLFDNLRNAYITTGKESEAITDIGVSIGKAKQNYNKTGNGNYLGEYNAALEEYGRCINRILSDESLRVKNKLDSSSKKGIRTPFVLNAFFDEVLAKVKGKKVTTKLDLVDISTDFV